jgi:L-cystine transport system substrate-binding protein
LTQIPLLGYFMINLDYSEGKRMNYRKFALVLAVFLVAFAAAASAEDDLAKVKAAGVFRVATEGTYSPFTYHDSTGALVGFDVEVAQEIARRLGVKAQFIEGKWDGLLAGLDANRYDAVINEVTITDARKQKYDFSDPYVVTKPVLVVKTENAKIKAFTDLKGKKVVADLTTTYADLARNNGASVVSADLPFEVILSGRADAVINDRLFFLDFKKQKPEAPLKIAATWDTPDNQGVIVRKGNPQLLAAINKALADAKADGSYLKISMKYFGEDVSK